MAIAAEKSARRWTYEEEKRDLYARFGVKEYWIGDSANKGMEVFTLKAGRYELRCAAQGKGKLSSLVLPELEFELPEVP